MSRQYCNRAMSVWYSRLLLLVLGLLITAGDQEVEAKRWAEAELRQAWQSLRIAEIGARLEGIAAKKMQLRRTALLSAPS